MNMLAEKVLKMSTREIAQLLEKNHSDIKRSAKRLSDAGILTKPLAESSFEHRGNIYSEYLLEKRDCFVLVAQNSPEFTAAIVDRWQELENGSKPQLPQTFAEALQLAADQAKLIEEKTKELEIAKPKVEFVDRFCISEGNKTFRQVAKILKANEREFRDFLVKNKIMYKLGGKWMAYQNHLDAKRFYVSTGVADNEHAFTNCKFTPKGIEYVAGKWMARDL